MDEVCYVAGGGQVYREAWDYLTEIDITQVHESASGSVTFPDVDPDLAPLFTKNYKILPGRTLATVKLEAEEDVHA